MVRELNHVTDTVELKHKPHQAITEEVSRSFAARVLVVIPCYNQAQFLPDAVESVCSQSYGRLEVVIVDDGSQDDTAEVARALAAAHPQRRIQLVQQHNQGLPASRNRGIETSDSEYVLPLDADDALVGGFIESCVAELDRRSDISIAYGGQQNFGEDNGFYPHGPYDFISLTHANQIGVASMFRRRAWAEVGGYSEHLCSRNGVAYEDWDFWIGCGERGHFGGHVPQAVFRYRVRKGSMFSKVNDQRTKAHIVLNHPVLYSPEQQRWARGVADGDPAALAVDGPRHQIPILGIPRVAGVRSGGAIAGARRFATVALADELVEQPQLVRGYCATFSEDDDATLVVIGSTEHLDRLRQLLCALNLDGDDTADLLGLLAEDGACELVEAATKVDAVLTRRPLRLPVPLPRVDDARLSELRTRQRAGRA